MKTGRSLLTETLLTTTLLGAALGTAAPAFAQSPQAAAQPETIPQTDQAPGDIDSAAGGITHQDTHRARRIGVGPGGPRERQENGGRQ